METLEIQTEILNLPDHARLWVYQSDRPFSTDEIIELQEVLENFISAWAAHGSQLSAASDIIHDQFIILAVDERQALASGCSIDSSVGLIRQIQSQYQVSLLDKSQIAYLDKQGLKIVPFNKVKTAIVEGVILKDTKIFNNAVATVGEWKSNWQQAARDSWMARFFG